MLLSPRELTLWHVNARGARARLEELRAATTAATVVSVQETYLTADIDAGFWTRHWPDHRAYSIPHDADGVGVTLLVRACLRQREVVRMSGDRHRLLGVEVVLPGGRRLTISSLYQSPSRDFNVELLRRALEPPCAIVLGDLNARAEELGCRTTNAHGRALLAFLESSPAVVLNDPSRPTFAHASCPSADCLDWALATPAAAGLFGCSIGVDIGSDHLPLVLSGSGLPLRSSAANPPPRWRTSHVEDWRPFTAEVDAQLRRLELYPVAGQPTCASEVERLADGVQLALQRSADATLSRSEPRTDRGRLPLPWWLLLLVRERRRLKRRYAARPDDDKRRELNKLTREVRRLLEEHRRQELERKASSFARGPRDHRFWPAVRRWFSGGASAPPPLTRADGEQAADPAGLPK